MRYWVKGRIAGAIVAWVDAHGEPPGYRDWERAAPEHPAAFTVTQMFGTWNEGIEYAGYEPRPVGLPRGHKFEYRTKAA